MINSCLSQFFKYRTAPRDQYFSTVSPEIQGRTWKMIICITDAISYIFSKVINNLSVLFKKSPPLTAKGITHLHPLVQAGINNGSNSCYLNSVVQALSNVAISTLYREINALPKDEQNKIKQVREQLKKLHDKLSSKTTVSSSEINAFRNLLRTNGFQASSTSQEDAEQLCSYLLDILHIKPVRYLLETAHEAPVPIPHLDVATVQQSPMLPLKYEQAAKDSSIQQLLYSSPYNEEFDIESLKKTLPDECLKKLNSLGSSPKSFVALRSIALEPDNIPKLLPIHLSRFTYIHGSLRKKSDTIHPSEEISLPIAGSTSQASYELSAIVIHRGEVVDAGHYYCYIPKL